MWIEVFRHGARRSVSIASQYGTGAAGESMMRSNSTLELAHPTKFRQETLWPWHEVASGGLEGAPVPRRLATGLGLFDRLAECLGHRAGIRQGPDGARA